MSGSSIDVKSKIKPNLSISEPPLYRVIYVNDEKTTMEFVISSLIEFFEYTIKLFNDNSALDLTSISIQFLNNKFFIKFFFSFRI